MVPIREGTLLDLLLVNKGLVGDAMVGGRLGHSDMIVSHWRRGGSLELPLGTSGG